MTLCPRLGRVLFVAAVAFAGCGGGQPDVDAAFHRIQRFEATIAHHELAREACVEDATCAAETEICNAAAGICNEASALGDADARARCERAEMQCGRGE